MARLGRLPLKLRIVAKQLAKQWMTITTSESCFELKAMTEVEGQTVELKQVNGFAAMKRMCEIDSWAEKLGIDDYVNAGRNCVRISKDEYVTLFNLTFPHYLG
jgi:hypothetical protein